MTLIKAICKKYNLGNLQQKTTFAKHERLWKIKTELGFFAVKQFSIDDFSNEYIIQGEKIAQAFFSLGLPAITAVADNENKIVFEINDKRFLITKWYEGTALPLTAASDLYAYNIGCLLACLHAAQLNMPNVQSSYWQVFTPEDSEIFLNKKIASLINFFFPELSAALKRYFEAKENMDHQWVISHGDLTQTNVIWRDADSPWVIDWEAAGWIHPQVELLGVLLNWSGISTGSLQQQSFKNILQGYRTAGGKIKIDETIFWSGLGSWFAWLAFNVRKFIVGQKSAETEIVNTLLTLQRLIQSFSLMQEWLNNN